MELGHGKEEQLFLFVCTWDFHDELSALAYGIFVESITAVQQLLEYDHQRLLPLG